MPTQQQEFDTGRTPDKPAPSSDIGSGWFTPSLRQIQSALDQMHPLLCGSDLPAVRRYGNRNSSRRFSLR